MVLLSGIDVVPLYEAGATFVSYNTPSFVAKRHGVEDRATGDVDAMTGALKAIVSKATESQAQ